MEIDWFNDETGWSENRTIVFHSNRIEVQEHAGRHWQIAPPTRNGTSAQKPKTKLRISLFSTIP